MRNENSAYGILIKYAVSILFTFAKGFYCKVKKAFTKH